jgi:hypothetical protein
MGMTGVISRLSIDLSIVMDIGIFGLLRHCHLVVYSGMLAILRKLLFHQLVL